MPSPLSTLFCLLALATARELRPAARPAAVRGGASSQSITCYDYQNQGGDSVRAIDYIPALRQYNMDNRIESCCFTGIWLLYQEENYNTYSTGSANMWAFGA